MKREEDGLREKPAAGLTALAFMKLSKKTIFRATEVLQRSTMDIVHYRKGTGDVDNKINKKYRVVRKQGHAFQSTEECRNQHVPRNIVHPTDNGVIMGDLINRGIPINSGDLINHVGKVNASSAQANSQRHF